MFIFFILATTIGALTGVGIWLSVALINPEAMGSLLRVFFWAWFTEWLVFVSEVVLILLYYLSWPHLVGGRKGRHLAIGVTLCVFSWITMALIVAILGFMITPAIGSPTAPSSARCSTTSTSPSSPSAPPWRW